MTEQNVEKAQWRTDAQWVVEVDEPEQPDPKTLLMAYMLRDGYTGAEVLAYLDRWPSHFPPEPTPLTGDEEYPDDRCPEHGPYCSGRTCCCRDKHRPSSLSSADQNGDDHA